MTRITLFEGRIQSPYKMATISGEFELIPFKEKRSSGQNKYMHKILFPMLAEGMSKVMKKPVTAEFAKEIVKFKFLQQFTDAGTIIMPTSKLNTKQCSDFFEKCQQYGAELLHISIPSPNEIDYSKIKEPK